MFNELMNGIHSINLPFSGNYIIMNEKSLIGVVVLAVIAVIAIALICKGLGALGRLIFKR